jgi:hypothetical protein
LIVSTAAAQRRALVVLAVAVALMGTRFVTRAAAMKQCKGDCTAVSMKRACAAFAVKNTCGAHG